MQYCMAFQAEFVEKFKSQNSQIIFKNFQNFFSFNFKAANAGMQYCITFQAEFVEKI